MVNLSFCHAFCLCGTKERAENTSLLRFFWSRDICPSGLGYVQSIICPSLGLFYDVSSLVFDLSQSIGKFPVFRSRIRDRTISLRFLGIISDLRFLYTMFALQPSFKPLLLWGGGGGGGASGGGGGLGFGGGTGERVCAKIVP